VDEIIIAQQNTHYLICMLPVMLSNHMNYILALHMVAYVVSIFFTELYHGNCLISPNILNATTMNIKMDIRMVNSFLVLVFKRIIYKTI